MMNNIEKQYQNAANLNTRKSIHEKYSTNEQSFGDWIVSQYQIEPNSRILELGCGTGDIWNGHFQLLDNGSTMLLTDFSAGMLDETKANTAGHENIDYQVVDIQHIPYKDESFNIVIANMMLYHVPDLSKGLSEVYRVMKPGGKFYCATYGEHGIMEYVNDTLADLHVSGSIGKTFTLQNGGEILGHYFDRVKRLDREDGLAITCVEDFVDYVMSMSSLTGLEDISYEILLQAFRKKVTDGILYVPKEYGMFICKK